MKLLHIADLHIGKNVNGFSLLEDQRYILEQILRIAKQREVEALLLAGDLYDKTTPSAEAVSVLDWFLTQANEAGLAVFAIPGNHDSAERVAYAAGLLERHKVYMSPVFAGIPHAHLLHDEHGPVKVWLLPFLKPVHVRPYFPDAEINQDYTKAIATVLDACDIDEGERNVILAHQFVVGPGAIPETCDSEITVGGLDSVDVSVFDKFDYVALGHIHRAQRVIRDEVRYAGSPLKYSLSEIGHSKSAALVTLGAKGSVDTELLELKPMRDMRCIRGPLAELCAPEVVSGQNQDDYLRVVLTDEEPQLNALSLLRSNYPNLMSLEYDNSRTKHVSSLQDAPVEKETDALSLFRIFFENQNGHPMNESQKAIVSEALHAAKVIGKEVE